MPLGATIMRGIYASTNPTSKYRSLLGAKMRIESNIYLYRCRVGLYNIRKAGKKSAQKQEKAHDKNDNKNKGTLKTKIVA